MTDYGQGMLDAFRVSRRLTASLSFYLDDITNCHVSDGTPAENVPIDQRRYEINKLQQAAKIFSKLVSASFSGQFSLDKTMDL